MHLCGAVLCPYVVSLVWFGLLWQGREQNYPSEQNLGLGEGSRYHGNGSQASPPTHLTGRYSDLWLGKLISYKPMQLTKRLNKMG